MITLLSNFNNCIVAPCKVLYNCRGRDRVKDFAFSAVKDVALWIVVVAL